MSALALHACIAAFGLLAVPAYLALGRRAAAYGRHAPPSGRGLPSRWAWIAMELPSAISFALVSGGPPRGWAQGALLWWLWMIHYAHRGLVYPLRLRSTRRVPPWIVASAFCFTSVNGALMAASLYRVGPELGRAALTDPRVWIGAMLFCIGMWANLDSDARLLRTPRAARGGYQIPRGGLFRFVSSPNYLGEIVEWLGFAVAAGSSAALVFLSWTLANLVPRARAHHAWCRATFADYPPERRALWPQLGVVAVLLSGCGAHAEVRGEVDIAAPPEIVWEVLTDAAQYPDWNPFTVRVDGTIAEGREVTLHVVLRPGQKQRLQRQRVLALEAARLLVWQTQVGTRHTLTARRTQRLLVRDGGTHYSTVDSFSGGLVPLVMRLYRRDLERDFAAMCDALRRRAEAIARARGTPTAPVPSPHGTGG